MGICGKYGETSVGKVERITNAQIILVGGGRFRKKDGFNVGHGAWDLITLTPATIEFVNRIRLKNRSRHLQNLINKTTIIDLGIDKIEQIIKIIEGGKMESPSIEKHMEKWDVPQ